MRSNKTNHKKKRINFFFGVRAFERYIWTTMNLGYIDFFLSSQEFNIASISLVLSLSLWSFVVVVVVVILFSSFANSCFIPFYFILFFVTVSPFQTRALYFFYCRHCRCRFFLLFLLLTVILYSFVCLFFLFWFFICTNNFHQINLWWAQKSANGREYIYYTNRSMVFRSLSVLSNSIIPSLAAYFTMLIVIFFSLLFSFVPRKFCNRNFQTSKTSFM